MNKRNNGLVAEVQNNVLDNANVSEETKAIVSKLLTSYESSTYKEYEDRHQWYRDVVDDMVNDMSFEDDKLAEKMTTNHPTLQQSFFRMITLFIKKMSTKTYWDARNETSVSLCKKLNEVLDKEDSYIPFI